MTVFERLTNQSRWWQGSVKKDPYHHRKTFHSNRFGLGNISTYKWHTLILCTLGKRLKLNFWNQNLDFMRESSIFDFQKKIILARKFKVSSFRKFSSKNRIFVPVCNFSLFLRKNSIPKDSQNFHTFADVSSRKWNEMDFLKGVEWNRKIADRQNGNFKCCVMVKLS